MNQEGGRGWFGALTACIGDGRIALQHGNANTVGISMIQLSFLKQLLSRTCEFGIATMAYSAITMTHVQGLAASWMRGPWERPDGLCDPP